MDRRIDRCDEARSCWKTLGVFLVVSVVVGSAMALRATLCWLNGSDLPSPFPKDRL
jgi:hypothetical protein